jgi:predicted nucleic acid-binding protein
MPFVVDASVVGSWLLPDEQHPEAVTALDRLKDDEAFAPSLLWFELRNLLLANERRQRITPTQTATTLKLVQELPLWLDNQADSETTLQLARAQRMRLHLWKNLKTRLVTSTRRPPSPPVSPVSEI